MEEKPRKVIEIPETDIWTTLFERKDKPFPDDQVLYLNPITNRYYTYTTLLTSTQTFGNALRSTFNFQKGDVLAIFCKNTIDFPVVTWGTHFIGGIISPASPVYGVRELAFQLRDCGAKAVVTDRDGLGVVLEAIAEVGIGRERVVLVGEEEGGVEGVVGLQDFLKGGKEGNGERRVRVVKDDLAFLVYSSGTTGLPKGVMLSHGNVVSDLFMVSSAEGSLLHWRNDRILSVLPFYHIYGLQTLVHVPAYNGFTTIVMSSFDLRRFCQLIQDHKITYTYVAPPVVLHLAKSPIVKEHDLSSLRMVTCGAAPLTKELIFAVKERLGTVVKQAYGLSETSPVTHIQLQWDDGIGSCGPPLPNQIVKFMSVDGKRVATGIEGELWIKGPNIFQGYLNNPSATSSSITPDGFFKTGDIGFEDEKGNMFITDRVKELIKYKGFQVAPAELEGVLNGCGEVEDCAVIGIWDGERETEVPMACVVTKGNRGEEEKRKIEMWVEARVAGHKRLRGGIVWVEEVPKSPSGKILRRELRDKFKGLKVKAKL